MPKPIVSGVCVVGVAAAGQTHNYKTGQRSSFQKAAAAWLDFTQNIKRSFACENASQPCQWIARRQVKMPYLADGNQRRQRITDNRQTQCRKPSPRKSSQFER